MTFIRTYTGRLVDPLDLKPSDISIVDIAQSLSCIGRFGGHVDFYSVAQHSILVASQMPPQGQLEGLLHDASEAYLGDVVRPLKHSPGWAQYRIIEARAEKVIATAFKLGMDHWHPFVKTADNRALATEQRQLQDHQPGDADLVDFPPLDEVVIIRMNPQAARTAFHEAFKVASRNR